MRALFILALFGVLLASGLFFMGVRSYMRWQEEQHYFGEIVRLTDGGFVISDAKSKESIIDLGEQTMVRLGTRILQNGLQVGDHVIVIGKRSADGHVKAALIRIVENTKKGTMLRENQK